MRKKYTFDNGNTLEIITNNHWHEIEYEYNEDIKDFEAGFYYKGYFHLLGDYMATNNKIHMPYVPHWMKDWDGYQNDSFFSGTLIKFSECGDCVKVGWYIC